MQYNDILYNIASTYLNSKLKILHKLKIKGNSFNHLFHLVPSTQTKLVPGWTLCEDEHQEKMTFKN